MSFSVLGLLGWIVTDQLVDLSRQFPATKQNLIARTQWVSASLNKVLDEASRFGRLRQRPANTSESEEQKTGTASGATASKRPRTNDRKTKAPSSPLEADATKFDEAGELMESPAERDAVPVRLVGESPSPFDFSKAGWPALSVRSPPPSS